MPRDPAGNFTLVPGYRAEAGQTIRTEQHNPPLEDIAQGVTNSLARDGRGGMVGPLDMGSFPIRNVGPGSTASDVANVGQASVPIGSVVSFAGASAPAGWFFCEGQSLNRADYPALFAAIGATYGATNGSTFRLPDCRGRVIAGKDDMGGADAGRLSSFFGAAARTIGGAFGTAAHVLTWGQMAAHGHGVSDPGHAHSQQIRTAGIHRVQGGPNAISVALEPTETIGTGGALTGIGIQIAGGNEPHTNTQPTIIMNTIIKATL